MHGFIPHPWATPSALTEFLNCPEIWEALNFYRLRRKWRTGSSSQHTFFCGKDFKSNPRSHEVYLRILHKRAHSKICLWQHMKNPLVPWSSCDLVKSNYFSCAHWNSPGILTVISNCCHKLWARLGTVPKGSWMSAVYNFYEYPTGIC